MTESNWADYVFNDEYELRSLESVETYIKENKRLPEMPSVDEIGQNGLEVSGILSKQMQKIEELTLYIIEQQKRITAMEEKFAAKGE